MTSWESKAEFKERVLEWAVKLDVHVRSLAVRPMRAKWASCSTNGNLNFNVELLDLDREIGEYVIVHELVHFAVPNHGKLWKSLMHAYLGDYEQIEARLRALASAQAETPAEGGILPSVEMTAERIGTRKQSVRRRGRTPCAPTST